MFCLTLSEISPADAAIARGARTNPPTFMAAPPTAAFVASAVPAPVVTLAPPPPTANFAAPPPMPSFDRRPAKPFDPIFNANPVKAFVRLSVTPIKDVTNLNIFVGPSNTVSAVMAAANPSMLVKMPFFPKNISRSFSSNCFLLFSPNNPSFENRFSIINLRFSGPNKPFLPNKPLTMLSRSFLLVRRAYTPPARAAASPALSKSLDSPPALNREPSPPMILPNSPLPFFFSSSFVFLTIAPGDLSLFLRSASLLCSALSLFLSSFSLSFSTSRICCWTLTSLVSNCLVSFAVLTDCLVSMVSRTPSISFYFYLFAFCACFRASSFASR